MFHHVIKIMVNLHQVMVLKHPRIYSRLALFDREIFLFFFLDRKSIFADGL